MLASGTASAYCKLIVLPNAYKRTCKLVPGASKTMSKVANTCTKCGEYFVYKYQQFSKVEVRSYYGMTAIPVT